MLTNQESGEAFDSIAFRILDHYLGAPPFDWIDGFTKVHDRERRPRAADADQQSAGARDAASRPSLPLAKYAGTYRDAWYGDVAITASRRQAGDALHAHAGARGRPRALAARHVHRALARPRAARRRLRHVRAQPGRIDRSGPKMQAVSPATDFSFDFQDLLLKPVGRRVANRDRQAMTVARG